MKPTALLAVVSALLAQTVNPSPRELLSVARKLTTIEIGTILSASRKELIGKTFRVPSTPGGQELEVLLGSTGAPKMARTSYRTLGGTIGGVVSGRSTSWWPRTAHSLHDFLIGYYTAIRFQVPAKFIAACPRVTRSPERIADYAIQKNHLR